MVEQYGVKSPRLVSRLLLVLDMDTEMKLIKICNLLGLNKTEAIRRSIRRYYESEEIQKLQREFEERKLALEDD